MKKSIALIMIFVLALALVLQVACAKTDSEKGTNPEKTSVEQTSTEQTSVEQTQAATGPDTSKEVKLLAYMPGDIQPDNDAYMAQLNSMLKRDINATLEVKYLNWGEFFQKYPLLLASGEVFDFCYIASWADFYGNAQKGAYMDITELLPEYCPDIMRIAEKDTWKCVKYKNKIYGIPHDGSSTYNDLGIIYREDLREKYKVPEIKKIEDFEPLMQAVKKNEPGMKPAIIDAVNFNYLLRFGLYEKTGYELDYYGLVYRQDDPKAKLFWQYQTPEYKDMINLMVKWQKMGFWDTSDMANKNFVTNTATSPFGQGKAAMWRVGVGAYGSTIDYFKENHPDWKAAFYYPKSPSGKTDKIDSLNDGVSISVTSKNPERALMAVNKILTVQDYKMLVSYGIKDKDYVLDSSGIPALPNGASSKNPPYGFFTNAFSWFLYDTNTMPQKPSPAEGVRNELKSLATAAPLLGFNLDTTNIKSETAAVSDVVTQYQIPLTFGFVTKSIDDDLATLDQKMKAAGSEKIQLEVQNQADQYLNENAK